MTLRELAIRYGFLALLVGLVVFFTLATDGFASPQAAVFIFQSVECADLTRRPFCFLFCFTFMYMTCLSQF